MIISANASFWKEKTFQHQDAFGISACIWKSDSQEAG
jgi:hypothetical protein